MLTRLAVSLGLADGLGSGCRQRAAGHLKPLACRLQCVLLTLMESSP